MSILVNKKKVSRQNSAQITIKLAEKTMKIEGKKEKGREKKKLKNVIR